MFKLDPYLNFKGNAEEAIKFYKNLFGGELSQIMRFKEMPNNEKIDKKDHEKIMHVALHLPNATSLMVSDELESNEQKNISGTNFHLCITPESESEADLFFSELSAGGRVEMPLEKTFWGAYFGMCEDKFGIRWMINYDERK